MSRRKVTTIETRLGAHPDVAADHGKGRFPQYVHPWQPKDAKYQPPSRGIWRSILPSKLGLDGSRSTSTAIRPTMG
jgi:hypothetical protein